MAIRADGRKIVTENGVGYSVWDLAGRVLSSMDSFSRKQKWERGEIQCIAVNPDGKTVISGECRGGDDIASPLVVWNLDRMEIVYTLCERKGYSTCLTFSPDGRKIITAASDKTVYVWDLKSRRCIHQLSAHRNFVTGIVVTADGQHLITGSTDKTIRLWNLTTGEQIAAMVVSHSIWSLDLQGSYLTVGDEGYQASIFQLHNLNKDIPIVTGIQAFNPITESFAQKITALCPRCGENTTPAKKVIDTVKKIKSSFKESPSCLSLSESAFEHPDLVALCSHCQEQLRYNPFFQENE